MKRRKEEPLEQLLKTQASFKEFEDKSHQSFRGRGRGQREGRRREAYQGTNEMSNVEETVNLVDNNKDEDESTLLLTLKEDTYDCSSWYLDNGASNHMCGHKDKFVEIKKTVKDTSNNLIAKVHMAKNRLFPLNLKTIDAKCLKANVHDDSWCWHMRFGHLNFEALKLMGVKSMVDGIPSINHPNQLCEACLLGKHDARRSFPKETTSRTIYLSNKSPTKNVRDQTPQEAWSGKKPNVKHLRIFGSITYAHVPHQGRAKLDDRSVKYVFIGYDASSKGYKLYNPSNNKVVVSRDVEFDEEASWNWEALEERTYGFLPYFGDEEEQETIAPAQDATSPLSPANVGSPSIQESSSERPHRMRSIQELFDDTYEITNFDFLCCLFADSEPMNFDEAVTDKRWRQAMEEEIQSIEKKNTWELTTIPKDHQAIGVKWVYRVKKMPMER
ncbi:hypothetical protein KY289_036395 [Solanum tuberosum]|nr:hypothetical protein KY289_036395 [Solanum tuberosum]